ncbi:MAG TPA: S9 family peptidase [Gemmatimonadales bacterium]|nr:S9 family peptidase [Gemmatimonadales bacterium]
MSLRLVAVMCALAIPIEAASPQDPPVARQIPKVDTLHGEVRVDDYFWLREKTNPEVTAYLEAENAYTAQQMKHTEALQARLYQEMLGRIKETDLSVPVFDNGWWYYNRSEQGKNYPIFCRKRGSLSAPEEVYLDQNALAEGKKFHALGGMDVSPDGETLLYLEDLTAFREYTLYVKELNTGKIVDQIPNVWNGTAWANDNKTFFYMTADSAKRGNTVWRHVIGTPREQDVKVFQEDNVLNNVGVQRSRSGKYVFITADGFTSSEWRIIPTASPTSEPRVVAARRPNVEYSVDHADGFFLILTNDSATNFRIVKAPEDNPGPANWVDWLPHRDSVFVEGVDAFKNFVVVSERSGGLRRLRVADPKNNKTHYVTFPEKAYGVFPAGNPEFNTQTYRFSYSSLVTPNSVYDYDLATRKRELKKRQEIPSGYDANNYEVQRFMAPARDGVSVPVSVLLRKGTQLDGSHALLLYAYGSYGFTLEPTFNSNVLSLVDRGFIYAIAHIRGGQEMGRRWYDDGKMLKKKNTFNDFIDVAEELIRRKYTTSDRLVANGGSAGGLLMGAVANMRPELFRAIVADVPFVDVINTMSDASLPLTAQEWEQWGNPAVAEQYAYMRTYSPYDNVAAKAYPWMLVTTSLNDSQVMYWEPAKWVARLRSLKTDQNPLYLKTNMAGGHGGSSGRYERLHEAAFRYAFMLDAVGLAGPTTSAVP